MTRRTRERAKRLSWLTDAQAVLGWAIILFLVALVGTIYLRQASRIAAVGRGVQLLQAELDDLKRTNESLERRIAAAQSLDRLQQEALRLGFRIAQPDDIEYVIVPDYPIQPARDPIATPAAKAVSAAPVETAAEALWLLISGSVSDLIRGEASE